ncbi:MAG: GNAT family N-acetyltransferase [Magnetococcus sp. YQC-5]
MGPEFTEKFFFLKAFQGLTLTIVLSKASDLHPDTLNSLVGVIGDLLAHRVKVLILVQQVPQVTGFMDALDTRLYGTCTRLPSWESGVLPKDLWRRPKPLMTLSIVAEDVTLFLDQVARLGAALRLPRILLIDGTGHEGWCHSDGLPLNFINYQRLKRCSVEQMRFPDPAWSRVLVKTILGLLSGGVGAVSLCRLRDLATELFSYEGEGVFFSRRHYCQVRRLSLDDFSQAAAVIRRGEKEGFLLHRSDDEVTAILLQGYGAFLSDHHLSGVCGLITEPYQRTNAGEITALYALTRFHGEGIGGRLVTRLVREAKQSHLSSLFACVGDPRAVEFFVRHGFRRVACEELPDEKWHNYDLARKARITCLKQEWVSSDKESV